MSITPSGLSTLPMRIFWPLQILQHAEVQVVFYIYFADSVEPHQVVIVGTVREIEPETHFTPAFGQGQQIVLSYRKRAQQWPRSWFS